MSQRRAFSSLSITATTAIALIMVGCSGPAQSSATAGSAEPEGSAVAPEREPQPVRKSSLDSVDLSQVGIGMTVMAAACGQTSESDLQAEKAQAREQVIADGGDVAAFDAAYEDAQRNIANLSQAELKQSCQALEGGNRWSRGAR